MSWLTEKFVYARARGAAVALAVALAWAGTGVSWGQEMVPDAQGKVRFAFEQADIRQVTQLVGKLTGRAFVLPDGITGKVSILTPGPVGVDEVLALYANMLEANGYTMAERGGIWQVIPLPGEAALPVGGQASSAEESGDGAGLVTKLIALEHVPAADVQKVLSPLVRGAGAGALEVFPSGNRLVVTDTARNVRRLQELVDELDVPGAAQCVELVRIEHASPEEIAAQLRDVYGATATSASKVHAHMQAVAGGAGATPVDFAAVPVPQARSLVLVGMPMQVADAKKMIALMDVESPYGFGRLNAIFLKYLSAEEAAKSLNGLLSKGAAEGGEAGAMRRSIAIEPSVANNALLVDASAQDFAYVRSLVEQLDVVPQQVLVEVLIAEMNLDNTSALGVEWFGIDTPEGSGSGAMGRTMFGTPDGMMSLQKEGTFSQGLSLAFLSGTFVGADGNTYYQLPVYLRALAGTTDLKILSNIPLWAQNNLEASVSVVENIPILKSSVEGSGSDRDYIQNIERVDVGIKLALTPHVNPDHEIQIDLNPSIEAIVDAGSDNYTPTISKREVKTTVTVPDRSTVVLSGLIREDEATMVSKVPLLGDIPLLGWLFRSTSKTKKRTNLLIFVTPTIVTDMEMAEKERARLERAATLEGAKGRIDEPSPEALKAQEKAEQQLEKERQRAAEKAARKQAKDAAKTASAPDSDGGRP